MIVCLFVVGGGEGKRKQNETHAKNNKDSVFETSQPTYLILDVRELHRKSLFFVFGTPRLHCLLFILTRFFYLVYRFCNTVLMYIYMGLFHTVLRLVAHHWSS